MYLLRVLLIEDNEDKRDHVIRVLDTAPAHLTLLIRAVGNYEDALDALRGELYDIVILDLVIPAADGRPTPDLSMALIKTILKGSLRTPAHIVGLTEYREIGAAAQAFYETHLFTLEYYSKEDLGWASRIRNRMVYLSQSKGASVEFHRNNFSSDLIVIVARYEREYLPIQKYLFRGVSESSHPLFPTATFGELALSKDVSIRIGLVCLNEMGMVPTAAVGTQVIEIFRPRLVAMLGMCCGFAIKEASSQKKLLDVLIARETACWEEGKYAQSGSLTQDLEATEFKNRAKIRPVDDAIREEVAAIVEQDGRKITAAMVKALQGEAYDSLVQKYGNAVNTSPEVQYGTIVSGSSVVASKDQIRTIIARHPGALGMDMELYGLYTAASLNSGRKPSVIGIKGVCDFGDGNKADDAQELASTCSAIAFKQIAKKLSIFNPGLSNKKR